MPEFRPNTLYYGDNLEVLRAFPSECVDLVYLDPPFNSNRSYNVLFKESRGTEAEAQIEAFEDSWHWTAHTAETYDEVAARGDDVGRLLRAFVEALGHNDVTAYLTMMAPRLVELRRVMKPTASIYLHCDPTASHYLKVLMDAVFGPINFRSEVIWKRSSAHSSSKRWSPVHDTLLFYSRGPQYAWNQLHVPLPQETIDAWYNNIEAVTGRRFNRADLTAAGKRSGSSGLPWRGIDPSAKGRHWAVPRFVKEIVGDLDTIDALEALDAAGRIFWPKSASGTPMLKRYLDEAPGVPLLDLITDIGPLNNVAAERLGYPTQKPEALLEQIITASSNPGDIVLDPFCGCGTATVAAHRLGRQWIGIDITYLAVDLMRQRLIDTFPDDFPDGVHVDGEPADEAAALALAERDKYQFQFWAVAKLGGTARGGVNRKGRDRGVDGVTTFPERDPNDPDRLTLEHQQVIISVKGGGTSVRDVRDLVGTVQREQAAIGVLVTAHAPTRDMVSEAAAAGVYHSTWDGRAYPRIQILTAGQIARGQGIDMPSRGGMRQYQQAPRARRGRQARLDL